MMSNGTTNGHLTNGDKCPVAHAEKTTKPERSVQRSKSLSERYWIRPDLPSKCTWKEGTKEKNPHTQIPL